jgi:hypothetical protein
VLDSGSEVSVNDADVEGSEVTFTNDAAGEWTGFVITYETDIDPDLYLDVNDAWTDPVFGSWKVQYGGITADYEDMEFKSSGEDAEFTFMNNDNQEVTIHWHYDATDGMYLGTDSDEELLLPGEKGTSGITAEADKASLLYTTSGGEVHVLEIDSVDCDDSTKNTTTINDVTYKRDAIADGEEIVCNGAVSTIDLGSLGTIQLNLTESYVEFMEITDGYGNGTPESYYEGTFAFTDNTTSFTEADGDESGSGSVVYFDLDWDDTDDEIFLYSVLDDSSAFTWKETEDGDDDEKQAVTAKGTHLTLDTDENLKLVIKAPEEDVYANVFVTPLDATVVGGASGGATAEKVNPFKIGLAKLDVDAESMNYNMIIVGGPCANTLADEVMGSPESCAADFEAGKAKLKYFDRNSKVALLVAGYNADDTLGAAYVLADYSDYSGLSGADEVEVVVASLDQITVSTV